MFYKNKRKDIDLRDNTGFTLLLSVLIASIMLALGVSIFNILSEQLIISDLGKQSQYAFYAADTGLDCALYHDFQNNAFPTSTSSGTIECADSNRNISSSKVGGDEHEHIFHINLGSEHCAEVIVTKEVSGGLTTTEIESRGYNKGWTGSDCTDTHPKKLERAIRVSY